MLIHTHVLMIYIKKGVKRARIKIMGSVLVIIFQFLYNPKVDSRFALLP